MNSGKSMSIADRMRGPQSEKLREAFERSSPQLAMPGEIVEGPESEM